MDIGVAEARRRFKEVLDLVEAGHVVQVTRRGRVVAVIASPSSTPAAGGSFAAMLQHWRATWDVDSWPDDDPFADVRDRSAGRVPSW
jgi:prevent-host-death family protein